VRKGNQWVIHTQELSSLSRLSDVEALGYMAPVETHRQGTEPARKVCAVSDGAE
jgi:hypothetical protein